MKTIWHLSNFPQNSRQNSTQHDLPNKQTFRKRQQQHSSYFKADSHDAATFLNGARLPMDAFFVYIPTFVTKNGSVRCEGTLIAFQSRLKRRICDNNNNKATAGFFFLFFLLSAYFGRLLARSPIEASGKSLLRPKIALENRFSVREI